MLETPKESLFDREAKQLMRQQWLKTEMKTRKHLYTDPEPLSLFCGTYNVNGKANLGSETLDEWLFPNQYQSVKHDMYIIGFQEIVELNPVNVAMDLQGPERTQYWMNHITSCLTKHSSAEFEYTKVGEKNLVGVMMCVFIKKSLLPIIKDVRWATNAVGVMGIMGNKGGVTCRFSLYSTSVCVVCAHLAASRDNVVNRNADFRNIMKDTVLKIDRNAVSSATEYTGSDKFASLTQDENDCRIGDHDLIFWIGDFNYRIDMKLTREDIMKFINEDKLQDLRIFDQLNMEKSLGKVFENFEEGELNFKPTYKFQPGTDIYEAREGKKKRPPAWCDRILWSETRQLTGRQVTGANASLKREKSIKQISYRSANLHASDHKPVSAEFEITVRSVNTKREHDVYIELVRELDKLENNTQPKATVSPLEFRLDSLHYMSHHVFTCSITNVGASFVNWRFVPKLDQNSPSAQWCKAHPSMAKISPNMTMTIEIEVFADLRSLTCLLDKLRAAESENPEAKIIIMPPSPPSQGHSQKAGKCVSEENARNDNEEEENEDEDEDDLEEGERASDDSDSMPLAKIALEDILILRVENGRDYFLTVSANFTPSRKDKDLMVSQYDQFCPTPNNPGSVKESSVEEKTEGKKVKNRWNVVQSNLSRMKKSAVKSFKSHGKEPMSTDMHEHFNSSFEYESDENEEFTKGRITSVRVNRGTNKEDISLSHMSV